MLPLSNLNFLNIKAVLISLSELSKSRSSRYNDRYVTKYNQDAINSEYDHFTMKACLKHSPKIPVKPAKSLLFPDSQPNSPIKPLNSQMKKRNLESPFLKRKRSLECPTVGLFVKKTCSEEKKRKYFGSQRVLLGK